MNTYLVKDIILKTLTVQRSNSMDLKVYDDVDNLLFFHVTLYSNNYSIPIKLKINVALPGSSSIGDSYILNILDSDNNIVICPIITFNGSSWDHTIPKDGDHARVINATNDDCYQFNSTNGWVLMNAPTFIIAN